MNLPGYQTPEEAACAAVDATDKALGAVVSMLWALYLERRNVRMELDKLDPEFQPEEVEYLEEKLKLISKEEASLHRIESGLQTRCKNALGGI